MEQNSEPIRADAKTTTLLVEIDNIIDRMKILRRQIEEELKEEFGIR